MFVNNVFDNLPFGITLTQIFVVWSVFYVIDMLMLSRMGGISWRGRVAISLLGPILLILWLADVILSAIFGLRFRLMFGVVRSANTEYRNNRVREVTLGIARAYNGMETQAENERMIGTGAVKLRTKLRHYRAQRRLVKAVTLGQKAYALNSNEGFGYFTHEATKPAQSNISDISSRMAS